MKEHKPRIARLAALLLSLTLSCSVHASLVEAEADYQKGDYPKAFREFKELAELGQPTAQFNLAVMYGKGQGTDPSNTMAHAWASLAAQNGVDNASKMVARLEPLLTPTSLQLSQDLQRKYSPSALDARLLPKILDREFQTRERPKVARFPRIFYPPEAERVGIQGEVFIEYIVAPDGHARLPRVVYGVPTGTFDETVIEAIRHMTFLPARENGVPVATSWSYMVRFVSQYQTSSDYTGLDGKVKETREKAEKGDVFSEMLYGMLLAGLPQLNSTYDKAVPWFLKAAQAGAPYAQYQIGTGLLLGRGCVCDVNKGEVWLEKAAQADEPNAQVALAEFLLSDPTKKDSSGAHDWLERAAKRGSSDGEFMLAALLATDPSQGVRDPNRALELSKKLEKKFRDDPLYWEIVAAANAGVGDFTAAGSAEDKALSKATRLGWDVAPMKARRETYRGKQTWQGNLLAF